MHDTCLDVHGEILQVHGAGQRQGDSGKRRESNDAGSTDQGSCASILVNYQKPLNSERSRGQGGQGTNVCAFPHFRYVNGAQRDEGHRELIELLSVFLWSLSGS